MRIPKGVAATIGLALMLGARVPVQPRSSASGVYCEKAPYPGADWPLTAPAAQGFSSQGIDRAVSYARQEGSTSGMIVHNGLVVVELGQPVYRRNRIPTLCARVS